MTESDLIKALNEVLKHYIEKSEKCEKAIKDIKAEIDKQYKWLMQTKLTLNDIDIAFDTIKSSIDKHIGGMQND